MIYTKTNAYHLFFQKDKFKNLSEAQFENNSIYWYDQHDSSTRETPFRNFIEPLHWEHLSKDPTSKILMYYGDEYYNLIDLEEWVAVLQKWKVRPEQVYIICMDKNWVRWTEEQFAQRNFLGVNIQDLNLLMIRVKTQPVMTVKKRFSALSRNYNKWRLFFYTKLYEKGLLKDFNFTFNNINPYGPSIKVFSEKDILNDLRKLGFEQTTEIINWVQGMPYSLPNDNVKVKLASEAYRMIAESGINIIIESHFDAYWNFSGHRNYAPVLEFAPTFPTEKTYKPIACRRPFIIFSTPYFLKEFKKLGYKTFDPYIDETYDSIEDNKLRLQTIVTELERLSNLPQEDFDLILEKCNDITEHNLKIMDYHKSQFVLKENFEFLEPLLSNEYTANKPEV